MGIINRIENIRKKWKFRMDADKWEEDLHPRDENGQFSSKDSEKKEDKPEEKKEEKKFSDKSTDSLKEHYGYTTGSVVLSKARLDIAKIMGDEDGVKEYQNDYDTFSKNMKDMSEELSSRGEDAPTYTNHMYDSAKDGVRECEDAIEGIIEKSKGETDKDKILDSIRKIKKLRDVEYEIEKEAIENGFAKITENEGAYDEYDYADVSDDELEYNRGRYDYFADWYVRNLEEEAASGDITSDKVEDASDYIKKMRDNMCVIDSVMAERQKPVEKPDYNNAVTTEPKYKTQAMKDYERLVDMPEVETSIPSLTHWQDRASKYMNNNSDGGKLWGLNTEELVSLKDNFQKIVDNSELCMNFNSGVWENIVTGRFKNQFETGTTDGSSDLDARAAMADNIFGLDYDARGVDREKFGYMADRHDYKRTLSSWGPSYGESGDGEMCMATFKKDKVANRTTYTFSDSLVACYDYDSEQYAAGMVDGDVSIEGISYESDQARRIASGEATSIDDIAGYGYIECQFHGILDIADVESFRFGTKDDMDMAIDGLSEKAKKLIKDNKVQLGYFDDDYKLNLFNAEDIL